MSDIAAGSQPWYRSLGRTQWNTLIASNLGWVFDGYETYALVISVGVALRELLEPSSYAQIPVYAGTVIALTLLGWGIGGLIGGVIADYIGRKRAMMLAILAYSIMTGLSAFAWDWVSFAALRFLVGLAIGSEWVTGTSIVSELWPDKNRGKGVGLMQCGFGIGFFLASFAWLFINPLGPGAWRIMFLLGVAPALLTLWIRRAIPESDKWERVNERRAAATERKRSGVALSGQEQALARFTLADLFAEPEIRTRVILTFLMSLATTLPSGESPPGCRPTWRASLRKRACRRSSGRATSRWQQMARRSSDMPGSASLRMSMAASRSPWPMSRWHSCLCLCSFSGPTISRFCCSPGRSAAFLYPASTPGWRRGCRNCSRRACAQPPRRSCSTRRA